MKILMIDVGGSNVKLMVSGSDEVRKIETGQDFTPGQLVIETMQLTRDWEYEGISLGFPGLVKNGLPARNPFNLGDGWVGFDFATAFGKSIRFINDAALQALAGYDGGKMLFIGFGTSTGAALIVDNIIIPLDIGGLRLSRHARFMDRLCKAALKKNGINRWQKSAQEALAILEDLFQPDDILIGGGNGKRVSPLPKGCRLGGNHTSFPGAQRLWPGADLLAVPEATTWRILNNQDGNKSG